MRITHLGLLFLLPIGLMGCGSSSDTASTETSSASTETSSASTSGSTSGASKKDVSTSDAKATVLGKSGFQISVPKGWKSETDADGTLCTSADGSIIVAFEPTTDPTATVNKAIADFKGKDYKKFKENPPSAAVQIGQVQGAERSGTVESDGVEVAWSIGTVKGDTSVVVYSMGIPLGSEDKDKKKNVAEYEELIGSFKATA